MENNELNINKLNENEINENNMEKENNEDYYSDLSKEEREQIKNELTYCGKKPSANEIIPNIFVGNYAFALSKKYLLKNKITHILNCACLCSNFYEKENIFKYLYIPLYDSPSQKLGKYIEKSNNFIEEGSSNGNKILIHCGEGQSRSPSLCLMYMIIKKKIIYSDAINIIKKKNAFIKPNDNFNAQLKQKSFDLYNQI